MARNAPHHAASSAAAGSLCSRNILVEKQIKLGIYKIMSPLDTRNEILLTLNLCPQCHPEPLGSGRLKGTRVGAGAAGGPVLLGDVQGHELQGVHALHQPALALADAGHVHLQELVGHSAPQHVGQALHVEARRALRDGVPVLALEQAR